MNDLQGDDGFGDMLGGLDAFTDPEDPKRLDEIEGKLEQDQSQNQNRDGTQGAPGPAAPSIQNQPQSQNQNQAQAQSQARGSGRSAQSFSQGLYAALREMLGEMRQRWGKLSALVGALSLYIELSTALHGLYDWFPLIALAVAALCAFLLRRSEGSETLRIFRDAWRVGGATALMVCGVWCICFVGRGFSAENPSVLMRFPMAGELQARIAKLEGLEARLAKQEEPALREALGVSDAFLDERAQSDLPAPDADFERILARVKVKAPPDIAELKALWLALRVNEARLYMAWAQNAPALDVLRLRMADLLLSETEKDMTKGGPEKEAKEEKEALEAAPLLTGRLFMAQAGLVRVGLEAGLWRDRFDGALVKGGRAFGLLKEERPRLAVRATEALSSLYSLRGAASLDPDAGDLTRAVEIAQDGLALAKDNGGFMAPDLLHALGCALAALGKNEEAVAAYLDAAYRLAPQTRPRLHALNRLALARVSASDPSRLKGAEGDLASVGDSVAGTPFLKGNFALQLALAETGLTVWQPGRSLSVLQGVLAAAEAALELCPPTPNTAGHIRAANAKAEALLAMADASKASAPESLHRATETLEAVVALERSDPRLAKEQAPELFRTWRLMTRVHLAHLAHLGKVSGMPAGRERIEERLNEGEKALKHAEALAKGGAQDEIEKLRADLKGMRSAHERRPDVQIGETPPPTRPPRETPPPRRGEMARRISAGVKASAAGSVRLKDPLFGAVDMPYSKMDFPTRCAQAPAAVIKAALQKGANPNDRRGFMGPVLVSALDNSPEAVAVLIAAGADLEARDNIGMETVLMRAVEGAAKGKVALDTLRLLIDAGADLEAQTHLSGETVLMLATKPENFRPEVLKLLLESGAEVDGRGGQAFRNEGITALMYAVSQKTVNLKALTMLLESGADVNAQDREGRTALVWAALREKLNPESLDLLLRAGADINAQDGKGRTALMRAATLGRGAAVTALLERGADAKLRDKKGLRAIDHAHEGRKLTGSALDILEAAGR